VLPIRFPQSLVFFLKGMLMGIADVIPGVSGGTMALITGIYERLIHAIRSIDFRLLTLALRGDLKGARENARAIDYQLLAPLLAGILVAVALFAWVIEYLITDQTGPTYGFFFGLILGSAILVSHYIDRIEPKHIVTGLAGFALVFLVVGIDKIEGDHSLVVIFIAGVIAICAMILPGISGALILLIIGQYKYLLASVNDRYIPPLAVFAAGAVIGIVLFARLLDHMLKNHRSLTMAFLFGLMLGALRVPAEEVGGVTDTGSMADIALVVIPAVLGFIAVTVIERKSRDVEGDLGEGTSKA
jgi:putative membrane protein